MQGQVEPSKQKLVVKLRSRDYASMIAIADAQVNNPADRRNPGTLLARIAGMKLALQ